MPSATQPDTATGAIDARAEAPITTAELILFALAACGVVSVIMLAAFVVECALLYTVREALS